MRFKNITLAFAHCKNQFLSERGILNIIVLIAFLSNVAFFPIQIFFRFFKNTLYNRREKAFSRKWPYYTANLLQFGDEKLQIHARTMHLATLRCQLLGSTISLVKQKETGQFYYYKIVSLK